MRRRPILGTALLLGALSWACGPAEQDLGGGDPFGHTIPGDTDNHGDTQPAGDTNQPQGVEINPGWIGGACSAPTDCDDSHLTAPDCLETGFPNGFCTQSCTQNASGNWTCPDTNYDTSLSTMSRCIDANGDPQCASECDFDKSPTGCRPGYACVNRSRYHQPNSVYPVCLPAGIQRWPGEPAPSFDIGGPCTGPGECAYRSCITYLQDGYCVKEFCDLTGCPTGSTCWRMGSAADAPRYCLDDCTGNSDCRETRRYICDADDTCWLNPTPPAWDSSVGAADCATYASQLHPCDTTPDDYVVVRKSARNIALCNNGTLVDNFRVALGPAPLDGKEREGDGRTPEGIYYVALKLNPSQFHKALLLSYPSSADAAGGLAEGIITQAQKNAIDAAEASCSAPDQNTGMGGEIEIHGNNISTRGDWTLGCIAVTDAEVDTIFIALDNDDTIVVVP